MWGVLGEMGRGGRRPQRPPPPTQAPPPGRRLRRHPRASPTTHPAAGWRRPSCGPAPPPPWATAHGCSWRGSRRACCGGRACATSSAARAAARSSGRAPTWAAWPRSSTTSWTGPPVPTSRPRPPGAPPEGAQAPGPGPTVAIKADRPHLGRRMSLLAPEARLAVGAVTSTWSGRRRRQGRTGRAGPGRKWLGRGPRAGTWWRPRPLEPQRLEEERGQSGLRRWRPGHPATLFTPPALPGASPCSQGPGWWGLGGQEPLGQAGHSLANGPARLVPGEGALL